MMNVPSQRHEREVAHEHRLRLDLAGLVVHELRRDEQRRRVGDVAVLALLDRVLRWFEAVVAERERHRALEVLDRRDLLEDVVEARRRGDVGASGSRRRLRPGPARSRCRPTSRNCRRWRDRRSGNLDGFGDLGEGDAGGASGAGSGACCGARGGQEGSFRHSTRPWRGDQGGSATGLPRANRHRARQSSVHRRAQRAPQRTRRATRSGYRGVGRADQRATIAIRAGFAKPHVRPQPDLCRAPASSLRGWPGNSQLCAR